MPYSADQWDFLLHVWELWNATGKRFLPSQLIAEYQKGYGWILDGVMDMESFHGKLLTELKPQQNNG